MRSKSTYVVHKVVRQMLSLFNRKRLIIFLIMVCILVSNVRRHIGCMCGRRSNTCFRRSRPILSYLAQHFFERSGENLVNLYYNPPCIPIFYKFFQYLLLT